MALVFSDYVGCVWDSIGEPQHRHQLDETWLKSVQHITGFWSLMVECVQTKHSTFKTAQGSLGLLWNIMSVGLMCWCVAIRIGKHWHPYDPSLLSWKLGKQPEAVFLPLAHWAGKPGPRSLDNASQALWRDCPVSYFVRPLRDQESCLVSNITLNHFSKWNVKVKSA